MESLRAQGFQVPADVSVLGYDDSQFAWLSYVQLYHCCSPGRRLATGYGKN
ncbi:hypothetical protein [Arthrobacter sp. NPDC057013]|uniref:hypothetical protein n=1 Tax=Arthrobacter sp. NPDC057013 TaxID=3345999 RepID=UPI0036348A1B